MEDGCVVCVWVGANTHVTPATTSFRRGLVPGLTLLMTKGNSDMPSTSAEKYIPIPSQALPSQLHISIHSPSDFITCAHEQLMLQCHTSAEDPQQAHISIMAEKPISRTREGSLELLRDLWRSDQGSRGTTPYESRIGNQESGFWTPELSNSPTLSTPFGTPLWQHFAGAC
nr:uncharacterized protein LOC121502878 [Drosophila kikkawai]